MVIQRNAPEFLESPAEIEPFLPLTTGSNRVSKLALPPNFQVGHFNRSKTTSKTATQATGAQTVVILPLPARI